ncbi:MAG: DUF3307 domain-containing protein, partial [Carboxydocellales bacterium]
MTFLWLIILSHVMSDFLLQSDAVASSKGKLEVKGISIHALTVFVCTFCLTIAYGVNLALSFSAISTVAHMVIDIAKILISDKILKGKKIIPLISFIIDQALHLYVLIILLSRYTVSVDASVIRIFKFLLPNIHLSIESQQQLFNFFFSDRNIVLLTIYIYVIFGGAILTRMLLDLILPSQTTCSEGGGMIIKPASHKAGKYIGIMERAIIFTLVLYNTLPAVGFVLAVKSV